MSTLITGNKLSLEQQSLDTVQPWNAKSNCTLARDTTVFDVGPASLAMTLTASNFANISTGYGNVQGLEPGTTITPSMRVRGTSAGRNHAYIVNWVKTDGTASAAAQVKAPMGTSVANSWTTLTAAGITVPADATRAEFIIVPEGFALNEVHYYDQIFFGVAVSDQPADPSTGSTIFDETFPGFDGDPWPTAWVMSASGGVATSAATQVTGRGRMALGTGAERPTIAARRDVNLADFDITATVHGTFDTTTAETAAHARELHFRIAATADASTGVNDGYFLSLTPSTSDPINGAWRWTVNRRRAGVTTRLHSLVRNLAGSLRSFKIRLRVAGSTIQAKIWNAADVEPGAWQLEVSDTSADAFTAAGSFALVGQGSLAVNTGVTVEWDDALMKATVAPPTVDATGPAITIWPDQIALSATGSYDSLAWTFDEKPAGSTAAISGDATAAPTFIPDKAGRYIFKVTATNVSGSVTDTHEVDVRGQFWVKTSTGMVPMALFVMSAT